MRILIADDHELVRRGLRGLLRDSFRGVEITETEDAREALAALAQGEWDLVIVDLNMPGRSGLELIGDVKRERPDLPVLVVSAHAEREYAVRALKLGASGYVSKQSAASTLITAVRKVLSGGRYVSPALAEILAGAISGNSAGELYETLSNRELEVLRAISSGKTIKEISADLALSEKTVSTYRSRLSVKLGLSTQVELTRYALQHQLAD